MPGFERTINGGPPRIIGAVNGTICDTEEEFLAVMAGPAPFLERGLKVAWITPDLSTVTLYTRTDVAVPEEGDPEGPLYGAPIDEIVSPTNGRWVNSTVRVSVLLAEGSPTIAWERVVGVSSIDPVEFGLVEANTTE